MKFTKYSFTERKQLLLFIRGNAPELPQTIHKTMIIEHKLGLIPSQMVLIYRIKGPVIIILFIVIGVVLRKRATANASHH